MWEVLGFPVAIAGVALAALLASDGTLSAASFTVNSTIDAVDANPGDGVCATAAGECTLRAAVMEANALPGRDVVNVPAGTYTLTIEQEPGGPGGNTASSGDLNISDDLEIKGVGANESIIDGGRFTGIIEHVFSVRTASVVISDVTIQNGGWLNSPAGGIFNIGGQVTLNDTVFNGNEGSTGAAVWNAGTLTVHGGAFLYNGAPDSESKDGAISNSGTMTVEGTTFSRNGSGLGAGAIGNYNIATLNNITFEENHTLGVGAGILNGLR